VRVGHSMVLIVLMALVGVLAYGSPKPSWMVGLDLLTIAWPAYNKDGILKRVWGPKSWRAVSICDEHG